ncbi:hypothetical protein [Tolypothrix sp. VBCCA 56010]|uniref:hypothetical protein n=1 Tax=Tolypothrix sp. VBCCA 56010 TaxID=3137731 RepID=UPI003D7DD2F7
MKYTPFIAVGASVNLACIGYVTCNQVWSNVTSQTQLQARNKGLSLISQHVKSETCWFNSSKKPFKLGDLIQTVGTDDGLLPTSCVIAPRTKQYLQVAYLDGQLKVIQVYSPKEVQNQLSIKGEH